jgi:hypothetical protein
MIVSKTTQAAMFIPPTLTSHIIDEIPQPVWESIFEMSVSLLSSQRGVCLGRFALVKRSWYYAARSLVGLNRNTSLIQLAYGMKLLKSVELDRRVSIKQLDINLESVHGQVEFLSQIASLVAPSLSSLSLYCEDFDSLQCFSALGAFFEKCERICGLSLVAFDFGQEESALSSSIRSGFYRLAHLYLYRPYGNLARFINSTPIRNLRLFHLYDYNERVREVTEKRLFAVFAKYGGTLLSVDILVRDCSSEIISTLVRNCRVLKTVEIDKGEGWTRGDVKELGRISSTLSFNHTTTEHDFDVLSKFKGLKGLNIYTIPVNSQLLFSTIGSRLSDLYVVYPTSEIINLIRKYCINLERAGLCNAKESDLAGFSTKRQWWNCGMKKESGCL